MEDMWLFPQMLMLKGAACLVSSSPGTLRSKAVFTAGVSFSLLDTTVNCKKPLLPTTSFCAGWKGMLCILRPSQCISCYGNCAAIDGGCKGEGVYMGRWEKNMFLIFNCSGTRYSLRWIQSLLHALACSSSFLSFSFHLVLSWRWCLLWPAGKPKWPTLHYMETQLWCSKCTFVHTYACSGCKLWNL